MSMTQTLQTVCVEYRVSGALDGLTPAPTFSMNPKSDDFIPPDEDGIFVVSADDLGLIDPTFLFGQAYADRFIKTLVIYGPNFPTSPDNVRVVTRDHDGALVILKTELTINPASSGVYSKRCIFVPQGGMLQVLGMTGSAVNPIVVRLGIWQPDTLKALAAMRQACCCREGGIFENPTPPPVNIDINDIPIAIPLFCQRTITNVNPSSIGAGDIVDVIITGTGFEVGDSVVFIDPISFATLGPSIVVDNSTQITASFGVGSYPPLVATTDFDLIIGPPGIPGCEATLASALTVVVPA
jgi:hypothetical protein